MFLWHDTKKSQIKSFHQKIINKAEEQELTTKSMKLNQLRNQQYPTDQNYVCDIYKEKFNFTDKVASPLDNGA